MELSLIKEREAFKKRSQAIPVVEKKTSSSKQTSSDNSKPSKPPKKKKSAYPRPKPSNIQSGISDNIKQAALSGHRSNNLPRILKAVVDTLKERYLSMEYNPLSMEEILKAIDLIEIRLDTRQGLYEALCDNPKVRFYPEADKFLFLPSLGNGVRSRQNLLNFLKDKEENGMGGVLMSEIEESVPRAERTIRKLNENIFKITRGERDKEEVIFYNNKDYEMSVDEMIVSQWRQVSMDGQSDGDIEKYLENVGLNAMHGEGRKRKVGSSGKNNIMKFIRLPTVCNQLLQAQSLRIIQKLLIIKAPNQQKKSRKKARQTKVLNTHLDTDFLKDYSEDGTQLTTPTQ